MTMITHENDLKVASAQLERPVRGFIDVVSRCKCGNPIVITTAPVIYDGGKKIFFPTYYYLTLKELIYYVSKLEANGLMYEFNDKLENSDDLKAKINNSHRAYIKDREKIEYVEELKNISAGGMPKHIKCLHSLVGHSLAAGKGANYFGDKTLEMISGNGWWNIEECFCKRTYDDYLSLSVKN